MKKIYHFFKIIISPYAWNVNTFKKNIIHIFNYYSRYYINFFLKIPKIYSKLYNIIGQIVEKII